MQLLNPPHWKEPKGYSNGIVAQGKQIFVGGQIGWNKDQVFESTNFVSQCEQALINIVEVLAQANAKPEHLVRLTWYVIDKTVYLQQQQALGKVYRKVIGRHFPAMTMVQVADLIEDQALVEIEATAVVD
ncbi:RidA family protein [Candidatus Njordibacter sp. Uisw_056]|jgi:enamine deaminase RidA (YjgF/YER057c/UK114 family)|uniref:RidA family protein n=1 Tax=Candidatus Njordibacter sp. Uisw_056 TaxID=3230973 RepID=UPI003D404846|tara:strand:+ start:1150 stop:1539 length:390 start_codon:yes stop_codon:yes gene_type:complete